MTIRDVIENIDDLPDAATVFAERIDGGYRAESEVMLLQMTDEELDRPVKEIAKNRTPGKEYFLEIFVIREVLEGWLSNCAGYLPSVDEAMERVIHYAEHDA